MKFRTTLILLAVLIILLAVVILVEHRSTAVQEKKEKEEKLTDFKASEVEKFSLKSESGLIIIKRDEKGNWQIVEPLEAEADDYEASSLVENFASLKIDKVVEKQPSDLSIYEIPKKEVKLWVKGQSEPITIQIGMENPLDNTLYAKRADQPQLVLLPSYLRSSLDKKLFDLRKKDVLKFETKGVQTIELKSKENFWKIKREKDDWFFISPVEALAAKSQIDNLLDSLSRLRAKDFLAEEKDAQKIREFGLDQPEFTVNLSLPESQELVFWLTRKDNKVIATNSLSRKIIEVDSQIITDLNKSFSDLREKKVAVFNSWEATSIKLKKEKQEIVARKEKVKEKGREQEKWWLIAADGKKEPADESKVESALRKLEYLEAAEFIDQPTNLADFGLDPPRLEITITIKPADKEEKEVVLLTGPENAEKHQVVIKNKELKYLVRVDSSFLKELPEKFEDWKLVENKK